MTQSGKTRDDSGVSERSFGNGEATDGERERVPSIQLYNLPGADPGSRNPSIKRKGMNKV